MISLAERCRYYSSTFILMEIVKCLKGRETSFLESKIKRETARKSIPVRCIKAHSIDFLKKNFDAFAFHEKNYDLYYSVAGFEDMPMFSFDPKKRKELQTAIFTDNDFQKYWVGYDFVIDIDNKDIHLAYADAKKVKKVFDEFELGYSVKFSGVRGFHFSVKYENFFDKTMPLEDCVKLSQNIADNFAEIEDVRGIDLLIYQRERLFKVPYSLVGDNVALPLTNSQFDHFDMDMVNYNSVLQNVRIKDRGILERSKDINKTNDFIKLFG